MVTDGYDAYEHYAKKTGINHARCWAHSRRTFFKALYAVREEIRDFKLSGEAKQFHRITHSKPLVERFFEWVDQHLVRQDFTPSNRYAKVLKYVRGRRIGVEVFVIDPDVPSTKIIRSAPLRIVPMSRKKWLFCWTELGAKHVGVLQSLIVTCRLHGIDPTTISSMFCSRSVSARQVVSQN